VFGVGEGDLGTVPLFLSQENRSGSGEGSNRNIPKKSSHFIKNTFTLKITILALCTLHDVEVYASPKI